MGVRMDTFLILIDVIFYLSHSFFKLCSEPALLILRLTREAAADGTCANRRVARLLAPRLRLCKLLWSVAHAIRWCAHLQIWASKNLVRWHSA